MEIRNLIGGSASVCGPDLTVSEAARVMLEQGIGSMGVIDQGRLVGIFTERDALRIAALEADSSTVTVGAFMTPEPDALSPDVDVDDAAEWLLATGYRHLPVVEDGALIGVVSIKDVLWALREQSSQGG